MMSTCDVSEDVVCCKIAIITKFDLETVQIGAVKVFLNGTLKEEVYCRYPPSIGPKGKHLKLNFAVYGLRIADKR